MTNTCAKFQSSSLSGSCFMEGGVENTSPRVSSRAKSPGLIGLKYIGFIPKPIWFFLSLVNTSKSHTGCSASLRSEVEL